MSAQQVNKIFSLILLKFGRYCVIVEFLKLFITAKKSSMNEKSERIRAVDRLAWRKYSKKYGWIYNNSLAVVVFFIRLKNWNEK